MKFTIKAVEDVVVGDFLATTDGVFCVTQIDAWDLTNGMPLNPPYPGGPSWPVVRLLTTYKGYARFPHENVQVVSGAESLHAARRVCDTKGCEVCGGRNA